MSVGLLHLSFRLPACHSLKEKRSQIKPVIARLHREFNVSVAEVAEQDVWQSCSLLVACASGSGRQAEIVLTRLLHYFETHWPDLMLTDDQLEILN
jgi:uncharacterized protein YlxP (DUF503 family)